MRMGCEEGEDSSCPLNTRLSFTDVAYSTLQRKLRHMY